MQSFVNCEIDLPQKMKHLIIVLLAINFSTTAVYAQRLSAVRLEVASAISTRTIRMTFGHQIADRWSIAAETGINMNKLIKGKDHETTTHWDTLSGRESSGSQNKFRDNFTEVSIFAQYWPIQAYHGPVFSMGGALKDRSGADIIACLGYTFRIWNGIRADLLYNVYLIESVKTSILSHGDIRIGISYVF